MKSSLLVFLLLWILVPASAQPLTENQVRATLAALDSAAAKKDVKGILAQFSEDATISIEVAGPMGNQAVQFNRQQYGAYLAKNFKQVSDYRHRREGLSIRITDDGKTAVITGRALESVKVKGQNKSMVTEESATLKRAGGKVVVTGLTGIVMSSE